MAISRRSSTPRKRLPRQCGPWMIEPALSHHTERVRVEWTAEGHLDIAGFARVFDRATDAFRDHLGIGARYAAAAQAGIVVAESHFTYLREAAEGDMLRFTTWLLGVAEKRLHLFHEVRRDPDTDILATCELMLVHVDRVRGASTPLPQQARAAAEKRV